MTDPRLKIAVFVDFDNIEIGVKSTLGGQFDIGAVLEALKERGEVVSKTAYGDWKRAGDHSRLLTQHAIKMVQRNLTPGGDKNGADINLALDALEMAFTHDHINAFVIVGGDSDFITLVEKLKQYDKKVFVVGGRQFTSAILQKNCHEFVAYENLVSGGRRQAGRERPQERVGLEQAMPLVRRALKVLSDREVSPQLGLLKSTLLQLDSTFSERSFGASSFRDFVEKLAAQNLLTLKHAGRHLQVELPDGDGRPSEGSDDARGAEAPAAAPPADQAAPPAAPVAASQPADAERVAEAVSEVRRLLQSGAAPQRWPLYLRQAKQFLRSIDSAFDERRFGVSLVELLRACQREGLVRLERDRQGILRVFPGDEMPPSAAAVGVAAQPAQVEPEAPSGAGVRESAEQEPGEASPEDARPAESPVAAEGLTPGGEEPEDGQLQVLAGRLFEEPGASRRAPRRRKTAGAQPAAPRKTTRTPKTPPAGSATTRRTRTRRTSKES